MATLGQAVHAAVGQPSSVRVGLVDSINPVVVSANGVPFDDVGVPSGVLLEVGNPVVLLGQASEAGSDPASWLALGSNSPYGLRIFEGTCNATTNLPAALTDLPGTTVTFTTTLPVTRCQMWSYADLEVIAANIATAVVRPEVDGALLGATTQIVCENPVAAIAGRWTLSARALFTVGPGDHTVLLQGQTAVGVANTFRAVSSTTGYMLNVYG
jgi:hypothetical protein